MLGKCNERQRVHRMNYHVQSLDSSRLAQLQIYLNIHVSMLFVDVNFL